MLPSTAGRDTRRRNAEYMKYGKERDNSLNMMNTQQVKQLAWKTAIKLEYYQLQRNSKGFVGTILMSNMLSSIQEHLASLDHKEEEFLMANIHDLRITA